MKTPSEIYNDIKELSTDDVKDFLKPNRPEIIAYACEIPLSYIIHGLDIAIDIHFIDNSGITSAIMPFTPQILTYLIPRINKLRGYFFEKETFISQM